MLKGPEGLTSHPMESGIAHNVSGDLSTLHCQLDKRIGWLGRLKPLNRMPSDQVQLGNWDGLPGPARDRANRDRDTSSRVHHCVTPRLWVFGLPADLLSSLTPKQATDSRSL